MVPEPAKVATSVLSAVFDRIGIAEADLVVYRYGPGDQDRRTARSGRQRQGGGAAMGAVPVMGKVVLAARGGRSAVREAARAV